MLLKAFKVITFLIVKGWHTKITCKLYLKSKTLFFTIFHFLCFNAFPDSIPFSYKILIYFPLFFTHVNYKIYHYLCIYCCMLFTIIKIMTKEMQRVKNILSRDNTSFSMQLVLKMPWYYTFFHITELKYVHCRKCRFI